MSDLVAAIGFDLSLENTGIVALRASTFDFPIGRGPEIVAQVSIQTKKLRGMARLEMIERETGRFLDKVVHILGVRPQAAIFEGPGFNSHVAHSLGHVHGIIKLRVWQVSIACGIEFIADLPPANLKQFVTEKGNSEKNVVMKRLLWRYGYDDDDDNLNDGYACALVGLCKVLGGGSAMQRQVVDEKLEVGLYEGESQQAAQRRRAIAAVGSTTGTLAGRVRRRRLP